MKSTIITLIFSLLCGLTMSAQQDFSVVTGNVAAQSVNIKVIDTNYGTSSDNNGNFSLVLLKTDRQIGLLFSCVGYQDTLVSLVPQQDTIFIHFKMRETVYMLEAASVTAEKITKYRDYTYVMVDFEIVNDKFYILQRENKSLKDFRVLVTNMVFEPLDTMPLPDRIKPTNIFLDAANQCQIFGQDTVYQIVEYFDKAFYGFPVEKSHYLDVMRKCVFMTENYIYFRNVKSQGYSIEYYRVNPAKGAREKLFSSDDSYKLREIQRERDFHRRHRLTTTVGNQVFELGPETNEWENFVSMAWFHTKNAFLGHIGDTLIYFDHLNNRIETYNENMHIIRTCEISYPEKETFWRHSIYQDRALGKFYTIFGTTLNEIDIKTGRTIPKINANNYLSQKMIIYKGNLYSLKKRRDSGNTEISFIEKTKLY